MKSVNEYKKEIISLIKQMEQEHGMDVLEIVISGDKIVEDSFGKFYDKEFSVCIKSK